MTGLKAHLARDDKNRLCAETLICSIHSLPILDMALATMSQLRAEHRVGVIHAIIRFNRFARAQDCGFLFDTLAQLSSAVYVDSGPEKLLDQLRHSCETENIPYVDERLSSRQALSRWTGRLTRRLLRHRLASRVRSSISPNTVYFRSHADTRPASTVLGEEVRRVGGKVAVCVEGCYPPHNSLPLSYFSPRNASLADAFLVYADGYTNQLEGLGYPSYLTIGYPKLFPAWRQIVMKSVHREQLRSYVCGDRKVLVVLARGEVPNAGKQILPNHTLRRILLDSVEEVRRQAPDWRILIKPHPAQDRTVIEEIASACPDVSMTSEHPSVLASVATAVVSLWSTSIFDGLVFECPVVEYFKPNEAFRLAYPAGSAFKLMGIPSAETRDGFSRELARIVKGEPRILNVSHLFEHRKDLSCFQHV